MKIIRNVLAILIAVNTLFLFNPYWLIIGIPAHLLLCVFVALFQKDLITRHICFGVPLLPISFWILMMLVNS